MVTTIKNKLTCKDGLRLKNRNLEKTSVSLAFLKKMKCIYWGIQYLYVWRRFLKTSKDFSTATLLTGESWVMSGNGSSVWSGFNPWSYLGRPGQQNMLLTSPFLLVFLLVPKLLQQNTNRKYLFQTQKKDMVVYKMTLYKNVLINCDLIRFSWQPRQRIGDGVRTQTTCPMLSPPY